MLHSDRWEPTQGEGLLPAWMGCPVLPQGGGHAVGKGRVVGGPAAQGGGLPGVVSTALPPPLV